MYHPMLIKGALSRCPGALTWYTQKCFSNGCISG